MQSKRMAYRFSGSGYKIRYKTVYEEGTGMVCDISTSGCGLTALSFPLKLGEKILLQIPVEGDLFLEVQAKVIRKSGDVTGIEYTMCEQKTQVRIRKLFAAKNKEK